MLAPLLLTLVAASEPLLAVVELKPPSAEAQRLVTTAGLVPGVALDPERVRQAVQVLYATGRYEDVRARSVASSAGLVLTFELPPAPRLGAVVVEGVPLLSAGRVREIARLRVGELLWPARLLRAERDVAAVLLGRGYVDAQVTASARATPTGFFQAVFTFVAGLRLRVGAIELHSASEEFTPVLRALARPLPGEPFERARALAAAEKMRRHLTGLGRWRAQVTLRDAPDAGTATTRLVFDLSLIHI